MYGLVPFRSVNTIASGDEVEGISFDHFLTDGDECKTVEVMKYGPDAVDMTPIFTIHDTFSPGSTLLDEDAVKLSSGMLTIRPRDLTSRSAVVNIVLPRTGNGLRGVRNCGYGVQTGRNSGIEGGYCNGRG